MIRSELVLKLTEKKPHLGLRDAEAVVTTIFEKITAALARGDRVELRGFGNFSTRNLPARLGRNPHTGAKVEVSAKRFPRFKAGRGMLARLNAE